VLRGIESAETRQILVLNKTDLLPAPLSMDEARTLARRLMNAAGEPNVVAVSAATGVGIEDLLGMVDRLLELDAISTEWFEFPSEAGGERHLVHEHGRVIEEHWREDRCYILAEGPASLKRRLRAFVVPNCPVLL
jgi:GTPases